MQVCKPGSVTRRRRDSYHLSGTYIAIGF